MWNQEERLGRLSESQRERACDLRMLAAKIEPVAEELDEAAQFSKYDWSGEGKEDEAREKTARMSATVSGMQPDRGADQRCSVAFRWSVYLGCCPGLDSGRSSACDPGPW